MGRTNTMKVLALVLCSVFVLGLSPGSEKPARGVSDREGAGGAGPGDDRMPALDPQTLEKESMKASAVACSLNGLANESGIDADDIEEEEVLTEFLAQKGPILESRLDDWLATNPPAEPLASEEELYNCQYKRGCPGVGKCMGDGYASIPHGCALTDCGSASCGVCPDWLPDGLKEAVFESWCAYVCRAHEPPYKVIALGAVGISRKGKKFPDGNRIWCVKPW